MTKIASYVRSKLPETKIFFWDDMIQNMGESILVSFSSELKKHEMVPMMWGYMEDVRSYFQPHIYEKYGRIFGSIWIATAYTGAIGPLDVVTSIQHHYLNHLSWIDIMKEKISKNIVKFKGVALTGWSR
jgi:hexosaminidase